MKQTLIWGNFLSFILFICRNLRACTYACKKNPCMNMCLLYNDLYVFSSGFLYSFLYIALAVNPFSCTAYLCFSLKISNVLYSYNFTFLFCLFKYYQGHNFVIVDKKNYFFLLRNCTMEDVQTNNTD